MYTNQVRKTGRDPRIALDISRQVCTHLPLFNAIWQHNAGASNSSFGLLYKAIHGSHLIFPICLLAVRNHDLVSSKFFMECFDFTPETVHLGFVQIPQLYNCTNRQLQIFWFERPDLSVWELDSNPIPRFVISDGCHSLI